jgi:hypothetical protein
LGGVGAGLAAGYQMANQMGQAMNAQPANVQAAPPPLPGTGGAAYFAAINGAQAGPFAVSDLASKARSGELTRQTLVWKQGMANWSAAESVGELAGFFTVSPPPLPKV